MPSRSISVCYPVPNVSCLYGPLCVWYPYECNSVSQYSSVSLRDVSGAACKQLFFPISSHSKELSPNSRWTVKLFFPITWCPLGLNQLMLSKTSVSLWSQSSAWISQLSHSISFHCKGQGLWVFTPGPYNKTMKIPQPNDRQLRMLCSIL